MIRKSLNKISMRNRMIWRKRRTSKRIRLRSGVGGVGWAGWVGGEEGVGGAGGAGGTGGEEVTMDRCLARPGAAARDHEMSGCPCGLAPLHYTELHCTILHYTALHCSALHCTALHCISLHCTALHWNEIWLSLAVLAFLFYYLLTTVKWIGAA